MAIDTKKDALQSVRERKYLNRSFQGLRQDIIEYERTFHDSNIRDFSDTGLGGALVDMAAFVGDNLSYYLDHQFSELNPEDAVEAANIERHLRQAGVPISGASPAVVTTTFFVEVPAEPDGAGGTRPMISTIPIVQAETVTLADNGTQFVLLEDIDFNERDSKGSYKAKVQFGSVSSSGSPLTYIMSRDGTSMSGFRTQETFPIGSDFIPFREITLSNPHVTQIMHVGDDLGNTYYEVDQLTESVVFKALPNPNPDNDAVHNSLTILPAPYRFTSKTATSSWLTTLTFGGGSADTFADDVIPDPSDFALPLYGKKTFSRAAIDPGSLLTSRTTGVLATNTTLTVTYQYGGGLSHNVSPNSIKTISTLRLLFPNGASPAAAAKVRQSADVRNFKEAKGGDDPPTLDDLVAQIPAARNSQARIVTKPDLLSRIYTLPSNFGRVFRAGIRNSPSNPLVADIYIVSRNADGQLVTSPDTLKRNLSTYLNQFRQISDAMDIYDARVVNLKCSFQVALDPSVGNKSILLQNILVKVKKFFDIKNFSIDQPIILSDVRNIVYNNVGVLAVGQIVFECLTGNVGSRQYSDVSFDPKSNLQRDMLIPPPGGIFEIRFPDVDIVGVTV